MIKSAVSCSTDKDCFKWPGPTSVPTGYVSLVQLYKQVPNAIRHSCDIKLLHIY